MSLLRFKDTVPGDLRVEHQSVQQGEWSAVIRELNNLISGPGIAFDRSNSSQFIDTVRLATVDTNVQCSGLVQNAADAMTADYNEVVFLDIGVDNSTTMPPAVAGRLVVVANQSGFTAYNNFPYPGDRFNNRPVNNSFNIANAARAIFFALDDTTWWTFYETGG